MTRLERYRRQLAELEARRGRLLRSGNFVKASALSQDILEIERLIGEAEEYEESMKPRPIRELVTKEKLDEMGIIPLMIECHLVADFLTEISYEIVDICRKEGFEDVRLMPELKELIKRSEVFASFLTSLSPELMNLVVNNETFNASLHKKYVKYIEQRIK